MAKLMRTAFLIGLAATCCPGATAAQYSSSNSSVSVGLGTGSARLGIGATKGTRPSGSKRILVRVSAVQKPPGAGEAYGERTSAVRAIGASTDERLRRVDTSSVIISISEKDC